MFAELTRISQKSVRHGRSSSHADNIPSYTSWMINHQQLATGSGPQWASRTLNYIRGYDDSNIKSL